MGIALAAGEQRGDFNMRPTSRLRPGGNTFLIGTLLFCFLLVSAIPGIAAHSGLPGSNFESEDGNLAVNGAAPHLDWNNVAQVGGNDLASGSGDDSLKGAEQDAVPGITDGSIPPSKSDLKSFGIFTEADSPGFLHMFWARVQDPSGTTNMDFEFNQRRCVAGDTSGCSSNGKTPIRQAGDVLITYNLSSGGSNVSLWLHRWVTSGTNVCEDSQEGGAPNSGSAVPSAGCWNVGVELTGSGDATGSINTVAITAAQSEIGALDARTFGEASVDLGAIFGNTCFAIGSVYLKSRSSDTFTSALKDFITPRSVSISNCGSIKVAKKDDAGANLAGAKFRLYRDDGDGIAELGTQDVQIKADGTTGSFECETTSNGTGNCEWSNLTFGDYWLHETFTPPGHTPPTTNPILVEVDSTTQVVVDVTNPRVPATLKIKKADDLGNPLAGAVFTLFRDFAPLGPGTPRGNEDTITSFSCTTAANGICTITNIVPAGAFWVVETTTPPGYTTAAERHIVLTLGQNADITAQPFVNPRQHKIIVLVCHQGTNTLAASDVTIDGTQKTSLANGATLPDGVSEAELCGLGGAAYPGIDNHPTKSATIAVGSDGH